MPRLTSLAHVVGATDPAVSAIQDLTIVTFGTGAAALQLLYATTRADGAVTAWSLQGLVPALVDSRACPGSDGAGAVAGLTTVMLAGGPALLSGGGADGPLTLQRLAADGGFAGATVLGPLPGLAGDLVDAETVALPGGRSLVCGGIAGAGGLARAVFDGTGALLTQGRTADTAALHLDQVTGLASAQLGGAGFLYAISTGPAPGISGFAVAGDGGLSPVAALDAADGLWVSAPTALEVLSLGAARYLVAAAAGSGSLTVMRIGADGGLTVTDHMIDDLTTRFAGAGALAVAELGGRGFVVAAGTDSGVTLLELLPGGRLLPRATLAGGPGSGLEGIGTLALRAAGAGLDIFAAGGGAGLLRLRADLGAGTIAAAPAAGGSAAGGAGADLVLGGAGADSLFGGAGEDVIRDGAGADVMTGGAGADVFVLARDGAADRITDFDPGQDLLDLSAWPMLRDAGQLAAAVTATGLVLSYGDETLALDSASGQPLDVAALAAAGVIRGSHVALTPELGPALPDSSIYGTRAADVIAGTAAHDRIIGGRGDDVVRGMDGNDVVLGNRGNDTLIGGEDNDTLRGNAGNDRLLGEDGDDRLFGGFGDDRLEGQPGNDTLVGKAGADLIMGAAGDDTLNGAFGRDLLSGGFGADRLNGGFGNDTMTGGSGADQFIFRDGSDVITDFQHHADRLELDHALWGGGLSATGVLAGFARLQGGDTVLDFGDRQTLTLQGFDRPDLLAGLIDIF